MSTNGGKSNGRFGKGNKGGTGRLPRDVEADYKLSPENLIVRSGRVRAGYRIGEVLYGQLPEVDSNRAILHIIGERSGSGHHAFSVYITAPQVSTWAKKGLVDHNTTKVVSGIADTAPAQAATETLKILNQLA